MSQSCDKQNQMKQESQTSTGFCNHACKVDYVAMGALATFSTSLLFLPWGSRSSPTISVRDQFRLLRREVISVLELHPDFLVRLEGPRRPWGEEEILIVDVDFRGGTSIRFYFSENLDAKWLLSPGLWAEKMLTTFMEGANQTFSDLLHNLWDEFQSARPLSDLRPGTNLYDTLVLHRVLWTDFGMDSSMIFEPIYGNLKSREIQLEDDICYNHLHA